MNQLSKALKVTILGTTLSLLSITTFAEPTYTAIKAYLNPSMTYTLDGKKILEGKDTIEYKDKSYISIEDISTILGLKVNYETNKIAFYTTTAAETVTMKKATIKEVDLENNQITVLAQGLKDIRENYTILNISNDTIIHHETLRKRYTKQDLTKGLKVQIVHSLYMTRSLPPQTNAFEISILNNQTDVTPLENVVIEKATVKRVDSTEKVNRIAILPNGLKDSYENYVVLNVSKDTVIKDAVNKKIYTFEDLLVNDSIKVVHSPVMTLSLPPQTNALEITLLKPVKEDTTIDISSKDELEDVVIKEINHSSKYLIVTTKNNQTAKVPFTNKTKVDFDEKHKHPNVNSLKVGQEISIKLKNGIAVEIEVEDED